MKKSLLKSKLTGILCCTLLVANLESMGQQEVTAPTKGNPTQAQIVKHHKKRKGKAKPPKHREHTPGSNNQKELKDLKDRKDKEKFGK